MPFEQPFMPSGVDSHSFDLYAHVQQQLAASHHEAASGSPGRSRSRSPGRGHGGATKQRSPAKIPGKMPVRIPGSLAAPVGSLASSSFAESDSTSFAALSGRAGGHHVHHGHGGSPGRRNFDAALAAATGGGGMGRNSVASGSGSGSTPQPGLLDTEDTQLDMTNVLASLEMEYSELNGRYQMLLQQASQGARSGDGMALDDATLNAALGDLITKMESKVSGEGVVCLVGGCRIAANTTHGYVLFDMCTRLCINSTLTRIVFHSLFAVYIINRASYRHNSCTCFAATSEQIRKVRCTGEDCGEDGGGSRALWGCGYGRRCCDVVSVRVNTACSLYVSLLFFYRLTSFIAIARALPPRSFV